MFSVYGTYGDTVALMGCVFYLSSGRAPLKCRIGERTLHTFLILGFWSAVVRIWGLLWVGIRMTPGRGVVTTPNHALAAADVTRYSILQFS